jgi:LacI family transcriptional regulator, repressor for deo operon, udp, cdd, tsx, nupC, and nupG
MTVLLVVPTFITPFFSDLLLGVDRALSACGYQLIVGNLHDGREKEARLVDLVFSGQVDGVLLLSGRMPESPARSLADAAVPIVAVSVPAAAADLPAVLVQEQQGGVTAARHLLELGHRRFGYVSGPAGHFIDRERWAGFRRQLSDAGVPEGAIARFEGDFHVPSGLEAGQRFLGLPERPTAVFAASDMMAIGFIRAMHAAGLAVPHDVSVVGFDGIEFADYCEPPLTTVRQPREAMGRKAAELLVRLLAGEEIPQEERRLQLEVALRPAGSTGPPPRRGQALGARRGGVRRRASSATG